MTWTQAVVLGVLQGLTEFLPVSSSGHLVLAQRLLGIEEPQLVFDITVHVGTLAAVLWVMREEVGQAFRGVAMWPGAALELVRGRRELPLDARLAGWLAAGTVPAGLVGLLLAEEVESLFASPRVVAAALAVTGLVLWAVSALPERAGARLPEVGLWRALVVGGAQALAIVPGLSRSGLTVAAGIWSGLVRTDAARFSFLLSIPVIAGASVLGFAGAASGQLASPGPGPLLAGFVAAAVSGYAAISSFLSILRQGRLRWFSVYLWAVAALSVWAVR